MYNQKVKHSTMAYEIKQFVILVSVLRTIILSSQLIPSVVCKGTVIPFEKSKLDDWNSRSIKDYNERKTKLNHAKSALYHVLAAAEARVMVITVRKDGNGDFKTVIDAIRCVPEGNSHRDLTLVEGSTERRSSLTDQRNL